MFGGLRFRDEYGSLIRGEIWADDPQGLWSREHEIPDGQHIIGLAANTANELTGIIYDFNFITGPIPAQAAERN